MKLLFDEENISFLALHTVIKDIFSHILLNHTIGKTSTWVNKTVRITET